MSDADVDTLIRRVAGGDREAFAALYTALEMPLFRFVKVKLNDPYEAADLLHDVFLEVWQNARRFEGRSSARSWVFGIAYRKAMDVHRRANRLDYSDDLPDEVDESVDTEACLFASETGAHVRACLEKLKPDHRSAIELAFFEDMSYKEISEIADVPEGTVKTRVYHAKQLLMHCLASRMGKEGRP